MNNIKLALIGLGAYLLMTKKALPRGLRNNNPLNIRENHLVDYDWQGEHALDLDNEFEEFEEPVYGIRAGARILRTYRNVHGLNTISGIVSRWAPDNENDTQAYIQSVATKTGVNAHQPISESDYVGIIAAMIHHENGQQPFSIGEIQQGFEMGFYS